MSLNRFHFKELFFLLRLISIIGLTLSCSSSKGDLKDLTLDQKKEIIDKVKNDIIYFDKVVEVGKSKNKIISELGKPFKIKKIKNKVIFMSYQYKVGGFCSYIIYFDKNDIVIGHGFEGYKHLENALQARFSGAPYVLGDSD